MTIKAILRNGVIEPLEPLPAGWDDGQELVVEEPMVVGKSELEEWLRDMNVTASKIPAEEHDRFQKALDDQERAGKDAVRREWGLG